MPTRCPVVTAAAVLLTAPAAVAQLDWLQATPPLSPQARDSAGFTQNVDGSGLLLFGGWSNGGSRNDTWRWDGNTWHQLSPSASPSPRAAGQMALDTGRNVVVLFGGGGAILPTTPLDDTWEWNGTNWTQRTPPTSPPARWGHGMAYDARGNRTVVFGGRGTTTSLQDTWAWDGTLWQQVQPILSPTPQVGPLMVYDAARRVIVMTGRAPSLGNATYELDHLSWYYRGTRPATNGPALTYDAARERVVLYGGGDNNGLPLPIGVWDWDGLNWTQRPTNVNPPLRFGPMMAYDPEVRKVVVFGGRDDTQPTPSIRKNDTWELGPVNPAEFRTFGSGCSGSAGPLEMRVRDLPWLDDSFRVTWSLLPNPTVLAAILGGSNTSWNGAPLPLALNGMPGCDLLVAPDAVAVVPLSNHAYTMSVAVPAAPALAGQNVYMQGMILDPTANAAGAIASNGVELTIGSR